MKFYSPVGKGISLLRAQGSISYVQSNMETYDMDDREWVERLSNQYGCFQAATLRGDTKGIETALWWLREIANPHWHEIIAALRRRPLSEEQPHGTTVTP